MTAIAEVLGRKAPSLRLYNLPLYPFLALGAYLPFLLYMHRSKIGPRGLELQSLTDHLAYYHADLGFYVLVACILWLTKPLRRWSLLPLTGFYYLATFDWLSWHTQNKPFFFADLYRAIQLLLYYPEFVDELSGGLKARAAVLMAIPILIALVFTRQWFAILMQQLQPVITQLSIVLVLGTITLVPWLVSNNYLHQNSLVHMVSEQLYDQRLSEIPADRESMQALLGHSSLHSVSDTIPAPVAGDNVIIFIIETAPFTLYPSLHELAMGLNHPWLKNSSVVFNQHYSTYPASDRASYSILSGLYPPMLHHNNWKGRLRYGDSLPKALAAYGYTSYLFSTAPLSFYGDDLMYRDLGFTHLLDVERTKTLRIKTKNGYQWDRDRIYEMDEELINMVTETLHQHRNRHPSVPFLASVAPQSSHAPFNCPPEYRNHPDACQSETARIQTNAIWQFRLLERLIITLDDAKLLDNTLLVITGDHGIRSKHESTSFGNPNLLQQVTFHVPMMLASSRLIHSGASFNHPTSHVDIAPTVMDLLGLNRNKYYFHGRNLFDTSPRTIYFVGTGYLPASGFLQNGHYYMENRFNGTWLSGPTMQFDDINRAIDTLTVKQTAQKELLRLEAFLQRELKRFSSPIQGD